MSDTSSTRKVRETAGFKKVTDAMIAPAVYFRPCSTCRSGAAVFEDGDPGLYSCHPDQLSDHFVNQLGDQLALDQPEVAPRSAAEARQVPGTIAEISFVLLGAGPQSHRAM